MRANFRPFVPQPLKKQHQQNSINLCSVEVTSITLMLQLRRTFIFPGSLLVKEVWKILLRASHTENVLRILISYKELFKEYDMLSGYSYRGGFFELLPLEDFSSFRLSHQKHECRKFSRWCRYGSSWNTPNVEYYICGIFIQTQITKLFTDFSKKQKKTRSESVLDHSTEELSFAFVVR